MRTGLVLSFCFLAGFRAWSTDQASQTNFTVSSPYHHVSEGAREIAEEAFVKLSLEWFDKKPEPLEKPVPIRITRYEHSGGTGGATTITFRGSRQPVFGTSMVGNPNNLASTLRHEVFHMLLALHFRQPIPRWADEGASTLTELPDCLKNTENLIYTYLRSSRAIAFERMLTLKEYPADVMPLYAQGTSAVRHLIELGGNGKEGKRKFITFLSSVLERDTGAASWASALKEHYNISSISAWQDQWLKWVLERE